MKTKNDYMIDIDKPIIDMKNIDLFKDDDIVIFTYFVGVDAISNKYKMDYDEAKSILLDRLTEKANVIPLVLEYGDERGDNNLTVGKVVNIKLQPEGKVKLNNALCDSKSMFDNCNIHRIYLNNPAYFEYIIRAYKMQYEELDQDHKDKYLNIDDLLTDDEKVFINI